MKHAVRLELDTPHASLLHKALSCERAPRADVAFECAGTTLVFHCRADTVPTLRAACNSFLQWIAMAERLIETVCPASRNRGEN
jgi:tRNA threonylcarbamoyladenosine modification (KEOPS) complex  Pcc1 subunit